MKKRIVLALLVVCGLVARSGAEFRVWSSKNGSSNIEAQFIQMSGNKVVLENTEGKRILVPKDKLCAKDQEYLASVIPPKMKIKIGKDVDIERLAESSGLSYSFTQKKESIKIDVEIQKTNKEKCTREFKADLYIVVESKDGDSYKVAKHEEHSFSFVKNDSTHFSGFAEVENTEYSGYELGRESGWVFDGYLVVIEDDKETILAMESNRSVYESNLNKIKKGGTFEL